MSDKNEAAKKDVKKEKPKEDQAKPVADPFVVGAVVHLNGDLGDFCPMTITEVMRFAVAGKYSKGDLKVAWLDGTGKLHKDCFAPACVRLYVPKVPKKHHEEKAEEPAAEVEKK